jgi:hypothetical protein
MRRHVEAGADLFLLPWASREGWFNFKAMPAVNRYSIQGKVLWSW